MPREHASTQSVHTPSPDGSGFTAFNRSLEVFWTKDGGQVSVAPGWYQDSYPDERQHPDVELLPEAMDSDTARIRQSPGWHTFDDAARTLDWPQINGLIKILKRARDDAFGRPE